MAAELVGDHYGVGGLISTLSSVLERVASQNDAARATTAGGATTTTTGGATTTTTLASAFNGFSKPSISLRSYLERIARYAGCSPTCYVVAYIYLDRFSHRHPAIPIDSLSVHRFLITAVLTAVKFMDDIFYNNAYFAKVGGISLLEMNILELDFLFGIRFDLNVTPALFTTYCTILQREMHLESPPRFLHQYCLLTDQEAADTSSRQQMKQLTAA